MANDGCAGNTASASAGCSLSSGVVGSASRRSGPERSEGDAEVEALKHAFFAATTEEDLDDYDPRKPEFVQPATDAEVAAERLRLLENQIAHLRVAVDWRLEHIHESPESERIDIASDEVLVHYQRVLEDMLQEETQLLAQHGNAIREGEAAAPAATAQPQADTVELEVELRSAASSAVADAPLAETQPPAGTEGVGASTAAERVDTQPSNSEEGGETHDGGPSKAQQRPETAAVAVASAPAARGWVPAACRRRTRRAQQGAALAVAANHGALASGLLARKRRVGSWAKPASAPACADAGRKVPRLILAHRKPSYGMMEMWKRPGLLASWSSLGALAMEC